MKRFFDRGFLLEVPAVSESDKVRRFPSANAGRPDIIWNIHTTGYHVLRMPTIAEIEQIVATSISEILRIEWDYYVVEPLVTGIEPPGNRTIRAQTRSDLLCRAPESLSSAKRRAIIARRCPPTLKEATEAFEILWLKAQGNVSALTPSDNGITDPRVWLNHFYGLFWERKGSIELRASGLGGRQAPSELKGRWGLPVAVAAELRNRNLILAPQNIAYHVSRNITEEGRRAHRPISAYLSARLPAMTLAMTRDYAGPVALERLPRQRLNKLKLRATDLGFCSNLDNTEDISWPFAEGFRKPSDTNSYAYCQQTTDWMRQNAKAKGGAVRKDLEREDPFARQIEKFHASVPRWCALILEYRKTLVVKRAGERARVFLPLFDWLKGRPDLAEPTAVRREDVRDDINRHAATLHRMVAALAISSKSKNAIINSAHSLFEFLAVSEPSFRNPIHLKIDQFRRQIGERSSIGKTYRKRIPSYLLNDLKDFIVRPTEDGFAWGNWVLNHQRILIGGQSVFCPILPAVLVLLANWPLRINQVSWLDSGEMDEFVRNSASRLFVRNPKGIRGRIMGALQLAQDGEVTETEHKLDLLVAINKRPLGEAAEYTIPYVDERTIWIIEQVLAWQKKHGLPAQLVKEADAPYDHDIAQDREARERMPDICPLFRDPAHRGMFPPSYLRMKTFWAAVCAAYDEKNANWRNPKTGRTEERIGWPCLSKKYEKEYTARRRAKHRIVLRPQTRKRKVYRYDLYSLKVGGVSHLLDRGVPLAVVAAMAGHKTLSMTLRYFVIDRGEVRQKLSELAKANPDLRMRPTALEERLQDIQSHSKWLLGNSAAAMTALQHAVSEGRNFTLSTTGICPGARCEEGLHLRKVRSDGENRSGIVPGSLCGLCDFRVYGPAFLIGLAKEFNESIYALAEIANRQQHLRVRQRELEAEGQFDEAIVCRNEDEELMRRAEPDCAHTARLHEMISESITMAERAPSGPGRLSTALVTQKAVIRPVIEAVGQFEQWKEILDLAELVPGSRSLVPDQVSVRLQNKLMGMLARNGATPFLAILPESMAKRAALEFAAILEKAVPSAADREEVFAGRKLLREVGIEAAATVTNAAELAASSFREGEVSGQRPRRAKREQCRLLIPRPMSDL